MTMGIDAVTSLGSDLDHPEGITWGPDGALYCGGELGQIYRVDATSGESTELARTGGFHLGVASDAHARVYVCDPRAGGVHVLDGEQVRRHADVGGAPNDLAFGPDGTLYVSDSGTWAHPDGRLARVRPDGRAETWCTDLTTPNGVCLGPDDAHVWVVCSDPPCVVRVPIRPDGSAGVPETVVELEGTVPDGLAFAADGTLFVAMYRPDAIWCVPPGAASAEPYVHDPQALRLMAPTNLAFGVRDGRQTLFCSNLAGWHLCAIDTGVAGLPLHYPAIDTASARPDTIER